MSSVEMLNQPGLSKKVSFFFTFLCPLVLAGFVTTVAYQLFFHFAPFIWSFNSRLPILEYIPTVRSVVTTPRNGIQIYVLYGLVHLIVATTFGLYCFINKIHHPFFRRGLAFLFALPSLLFLREVGFTPPMAEYSKALLHDVPAMYFILSVLGITVILSLLINTRRILAVILSLLLLPICMVASSAYSSVDYNLILFPAMRIFHGFPLNQTGFQYDHLLSLLAVLWIKLGFSFYQFNLVGQFSVYAFFMGLYLFGRRLFTHKCYALYLLISAVLVRMYGNIADIIFCIQVTPLRLDWWLVALLAVYSKGDAHWLTGLALGFLLIFHHSFGVIYTLAYAILVLFFFGMDVLSKKDPLSTVSRNYVMLYAKNGVLLGASFLIYRVFFAYGPSSAETFRQHGLGFIPVLRQSFYWYVPVMLGVVFIYHWRNRFFLPGRHFRAVVFLILLAIGNSLYFFGRSHENNIINISSILLLCLFLLFDLVHSEFERSFSWKPARWILPLFAVVFIGAISFVYAGNAPERVLKQIESARTHFSFNRKMESGFNHDVMSVKKLTRSSPNVTFVSYNDGYYYYEGGYIPRNPYCSSDGRLVLTKDFNGFLEGSMSDGHYLAMPLKGFDDFAFGNLLWELPRRYFKFDAGIVVVSSDSIN